MTEEFPIDVAFSFVHDDEQTVQRIDDLLRERVKTYLYSRRQGELAGADGEKEFADVFGKRARLVVVFLRPLWGETRWTRIEMNAIKSRAFDEGYDFALFVPMEKGVKPPPWVPKTRIWFDHDRFGTEAAAAVLEQKLREAGVSVRSESAADRATRLTRRVEAETARASFRHDEASVTRAREEMERLWRLVEDSVTACSTVQVPLASRRAQAGGLVLVVEGPLASISIGLDLRWRNTLEESQMGITVWKGGTPYPKPGFIYVGGAKDVESHRYRYDMGLAGEIGWREIKGERIHTTEQIAEFALKRLFDRIEKEKSEYERGRTR